MWYDYMNINDGEHNVMMMGLNRDKYKLLWETNYDELNRDKYKLLCEWLYEHKRYDDGTE